MCCSARDDTCNHCEVKHQLREKKWGGSSRPNRPMVLQVCEWICPKFREQQYADMNTISFSWYVFPRCILSSSLVSSTYSFVGIDYGCGQIISMAFTYLRGPFIFVMLLAGAAFVKGRRLINEVWYVFTLWESKDKVEHFITTWVGCVSWLEHCVICCIILDRILCGMLYCMIYNDYVHVHAGILSPNLKLGSVMAAWFQWLN